MSGCRVVKPVWVPCPEPRLSLVPDLPEEPDAPTLQDLTLEDLEALGATNPSLYLLLVGTRRWKVNGVWRRLRPKVQV